VRHTLSTLKRELKIDLDGNNAAFLWGPRKVGKTTLLHRQFPRARYYDLLISELKIQLTLKPSLLREEFLAENPELVIVDEVQKVPSLLDEVHWCLENTKTKFIMCGSSARKLKRGAANLLGGRAPHRFPPLEGIDCFEGRAKSRQISSCQSG